MTAQIVQETIAKAGYPKIKTTIVSKGKPSERTDLTVQISPVRFDASRNEILKKLLPLLNQKFGAKAKAIQVVKEIQFTNVKEPKSNLNTIKVQIKKDMSVAVSADDQESLHAYYFCQEIEGDMVTDTKGKPKQSTRVKATPLKQIFDKCDASWHDSGKFAAKTFQQKFKLSKGYHYLQRAGSPWIDKLYKKAVELYKEAEVPFGDSNKWNPADMWICKDVNGSAREIQEMKSIAQLNAYLRREFEAKRIIGVSLKKMSKIGKIDIANMERKDLRVVKYKDSDYGKKNPFSTGGNIYFNVDGQDKEMSLRSFNINKRDDISAEIKGVGALAGKCGYKQINIIFDMFRLLKVNTKQYILSQSVEELFNFIYKEAKKDGKVSTVVTSGQDFKNALGTTGGVNLNTGELEGWLISKVQSIETIMSIRNAKDSERPKILLAMFAYASSTTKDSGPFVKVSN